jgi:hypothetical protein
MGIALKYNPQKCVHIYLLRVFLGDLKIVPLRYQKQRFLPPQKVTMWRNSPQMWCVTPQIGETNYSILVIFVTWLSL